MKIYKNISVFDESMNRIRNIFNEFKNVVVCVSGGKDSTVIFNLSLIIAKELNRLPLKVMFIDQEAEWEATIEQIKKIMYNPNVKPYWYQMPIWLFNATSQSEHWLYCWEENKEWMRKKELIAIKENIYNEVRYAKLYIKIPEIEYNNEPMCYLAGVRAEESPTRFMGLTQGITYKEITWGKILNKNKNHYTFYPIYDWSYTDIWKAIFTNKWDYNEIYNKYYMDGVPFKAMRISNLHHEKAVHALFVLQKYENNTYEKLVERLKGIDMAGKFGEEQYYINDLPFMFRGWKEYRDYLRDNLIAEEFKNIFKKKFDKLDNEIEYLIDKNEVYKAEVQSILTNDWEFVKLEDYLRMPKYACWFQFLKGKYKWDDILPIYRKNIREEDYGRLQKTTGR